MEILKTWRTFKLNKLSEKKDSIFNIGLSDDEIILNKEFVDNYIPKELLEILQDSNGQKENTEPVFLELGLSFSYYNFLSLNRIKNTYSSINSFFKTDIKTDFIPFATINKVIGNRGSIAFTINRNDKTIHKIQFYEWDRFITHTEFRTEKFANNLNDFLENQILWNNIK
jgi:hypothetical protein